MANIKIILIIFFAAKDGETIQSAKTRLGADCGSDHKLLIGKGTSRRTLLNLTEKAPIKYW